AVREQVYGFFIPSVTLIGIGASKEIGDKIRRLGHKFALVIND
nr:NAD-dependent alcohol dehydrogenase {N-terminal} [Desulfovibrio gigas, Peptide Partial, 42 aa] [Megalodesulfovibrio gigas]